MILITTISVISIILNVILFILVKNNLNKIDIYEKWILNYRELVKKTYTSLKEIDERQMFEKDDDVGFVFTSILSIIKELDEKIYDENA